MIATGAVAGGAGSGVGTITQNLADGDDSTGAFDDVGRNVVTGTIAGAAGGALTRAPSVSYKAPSYVANRAVAPSAARKAAIVSGARSLGEGVRDEAMKAYVNRLIEESN